MERGLERLSGVTLVWKTQGEADEAGGAGTGCLVKDL